MTGCWWCPDQFRCPTPRLLSSTRAGWLGLRNQFGADLLIVIRVYFEKPRTVDPVTPLYQADTVT